METIIGTKPNTARVEPRNIDCFLRRAFDIIASATGLIYLAPFLVLIAIVIKRDSPGPVFYHGPRLGRDGRPFGILKFRTMFECQASYHGSKVTAAGDARITPIGKWLRDTKLNELPQLWNVLVGDMSLVGPRPEDPDIVKSWPQEAQKDLLAVRPGVTSPATVIYRQEETLLNSASVMEDYLHTILPDKLRIDRTYLRRRSLLTDLDVLLMTVLLLLPYIKRIEIPSNLLYWGPISRFASRYLNWFIIDVLVAALATGAAGLIWRLDQPLNFGLVGFLAAAVGIGAVFSLINALIGLQNIEWRRAPSVEILRLGVSALLTMGIIQFTNTIMPWYDAVTSWRIPRLPVGMIVIAGMFAFLGFAAARYKGRLLTGFAALWLHSRRDHRAIGERVLLVGAGENAQLAVWLLTHSKMAQAFQITGMVDDNPRAQGLVLDGVPVLGVTRDIPALAQKLDIGLVVFTITNLTPENRARILNTCQETHLPLVQLPELLDDLLAHFQGAQTHVPVAAD